MDTNDQWIQSRVGIAERHFGGELDTVASMGAIAGGKALADSGLDPADIDTVILASCTAETQVPHGSTQVAAALSIHAPGSFDRERGLRRLLLRAGRGRPRDQGRQRQERAGHRVREAHLLDRPGRSGDRDHLR